MDWSLSYPSRRRPLLAASCVATSQPLAAQAGLAMLANGGGAVDAAVAAAIALTVVEPAMNGIGSDAFTIVADDRHGVQRADPQRPQVVEDRSTRTGITAHAGDLVGVQSRFH